VALQVLFIKLPFMSEPSMHHKQRCPVLPPEVAGGSTRSGLHSTDWCAQHQPPHHAKVLPTAHHAPAVLAPAARITIKKKRSHRMLSNAIAGLTRRMGIDGCKSMFAPPNVYGVVAHPQWHGVTAVSLLGPSSPLAQLPDTW
jgi:hypothetical protein